MENERRDLGLKIRTTCGPCSRELFSFSARRGLNGSSWRFITKRHSSPTEPAPLQRQRTNPFASGGKYGVGDRRQSGRQRWLTQTCWRIVGLAPIHLDLRRLSHADQRMVVEVRLLDSAVCQRDLLPQMAHSLDDPAKGDVLSRG